MSLCSTDFECPSTKICYSNATWIANKTFDSTCLCSTWYGWEGPNCDQLGISNFFQIILGAMTIVMCTISLLVVSMNLIRLRINRRDIKLFNASNTTAMLAIPALISFIGWRSVIIAMAFSPELNDVAVYDDGEKYHKYAKIERGFLTPAILLAVLTALNVSLMWIEIAENSKTLRKKMSSRYSKYKITIYVFEVLFALIVGTLVLTGLTSLAFMAAIPFLGFILVSYLIGVTKMTNLIRGSILGISDQGNSSSIKKPLSSKKSLKSIPSSNPHTHRYVKLLGRIRTTALLIIVADVGIIVAGGANAIIAFKWDWKEIGVPGSINPSALTLEFAAFFMACVPIVISWYCSVNMKSVAKRTNGQKTGSSRTSSKDNTKGATSSKNGTVVNATSFNNSFE